MKNEYRITGSTKALEVQIESDVISILESMAQHTKMTPSEIANTALKRFIASHKDFLPADFKKKSA